MGVLIEKGLSPSQGPTQEYIDIALVWEEISEEFDGSISGKIISDHLQFEVSILGMSIQCEAKRELIGGTSGSPDHMLNQEMIVRGDVSNKAPGFVFILKDFTLFNRIRFFLKRRDYKLLKDYMFWTSSYSMEFMTEIETLIDSFWVDYLTIEHGAMEFRFYEIPSSKESIQTLLQSLNQMMNILPENSLEL